MSEQWVDITKKALKERMYRPHQKWSFAFCAIRPSLVAHNSQQAAMLYAVPGLLTIYLDASGVQKTEIERRNLNNEFAYRCQLRPILADKHTITNVQDKDGNKTTIPNLDQERAALLKLGQFSADAFATFKGAPIKVPTTVAGQIGEAPQLEHMSMPQIFQNFSQMITEHIKTGNAPMSGTTIAAQPHKIFRRRNLN